MPRTPQERSLLGQIAAHESWAHTDDRAARTAPARKAALDRFEREVDPEGTLAMMARGDVAVEHCLSSAELILGVRGADHPFTLYRRAGVAQTICTDDEGVARTPVTARPLPPAQIQAHRRPSILKTATSERLSRTSLATFSAKAS